MRVLFWLLGIPLAIVVIVFTVINTQEINVDLFVYSLKPPLFSIALFGIVVGFIFGGFISWVQAGKSRHRARDLSRRIESDRREMAILREKIRKLEGAEKQATIPAPPANAA